MVSVKTKVPLISFDHRKASDVLTKRKTALLGALLSATLVAGLGLVAAPAANAATGDSTISVKVGSSRNANGSVAPGTGATLKLRSASTSSNSWSNVTAAWGTCTVTSASLCTFVIPDSAQGNTKRFQISMATAPSGYTVLGELSHSSASPAAYITEVTPADVRAGRTARQTVEIGKAYGYNSDGSVRTKSDATFDRESNDTWASSKTNPAMVNSCGLKVGILVDLSSSMSDSIGSLKTAAKSFITSLKDTPSTMSIFTFADASPALNMEAPTTGSLAVSTDVTALNSAVDAFVVNKDQGTNWDAGFRAVTAANRDLDVLLVLTDGMPTLYYPNDASAIADGPGGSTNFGTVEAAIFSANTLKASGTRVQMVGIGSNLTSSALNLNAVSGGTDGYSVIKDYAALAAKLKAFTDQQCAGTINIIKKTVAYGADVSTAVPAAGFTFSATMTGGTMGSVAQTTNDTGAATFNWTSTGTADANATITESASSTYALRPNADGSRASCVVAGGSGTRVAVTNSPTSANAFSIKAPKNSAITCTVINEKLPEGASIRVVKNWTIDGVVYASSQTLPIDVTSSAKEGTVARAYDTTVTGRKQGDVVAITDTSTAIPAGLKCTYNAPTGSLAQPQTKTLSAGLNTFTFEAKITCTTTLAVNHTVANGGKAPADWNVTATSPTQPLSGSASIAKTDVTGNSSFVLAATNSQTYAPVYIQDAWSCTVNGAAAALTGAATVKTPMGTDTVCTSISRTSEVTLSKKVRAVEGSTVVPGDWTLILSPTVDGTTPRTSMIGASTGQTILVRPGTAFTLGETLTSTSDASIANRFVLDNLECATGSGAARTVALSTVHSVPVQQKLNCTFTNAEFGLDIVKTAWNGVPLTGGSTDALIKIPSGAALPLPSGTTVSWTYDVTNTGVLPMQITDLVDDQDVPITCAPLALMTDLAPGATIRCTGTAKLD